MAQTTTSAPQQQTPMPAVDLRQLLGSLVSAEGVRTSTDLVVAQRAAGANMSVDIAAGSAVIQDDHASGGGFYSYTLAATTNVAVTGSDPTNPRVDRVVVRVRDQALGDAANDATVVVVAGTPTSGATLVNLTGAAAVPGSSLLLANVLVPNASSSVTTANIGNVVAVVKPVGTSLEIGYSQITSNVSVTSATEASGTTLISPGAFTFDGAPVICHVFSPAVGPGSNDAITVCLFEGATEIGQLGVVSGSTAGAMDVPFKVELRFTPTAGSHTYTVTAFRAAANGTFFAGSGGTGGKAPAFVRFTKA